MAEKNIYESLIDPEEASNELPDSVTLRNVEERMTPKPGHENYTWQQGIPASARDVITSFSSIRSPISRPRALVTAGETSMSTVEQKWENSNSSTSAILHPQHYERKWDEGETQAYATRDTTTKATVHNPARGTTTVSAEERLQAVQNSFNDTFEAMQREIEALRSELLAKESRSAAAQAPTKMFLNYRFHMELLQDSMLNDPNGRALNSWLISFESTAITASNMNITQLKDAPEENQQVIVQAAVTHLRGRALDWWTARERERARNGGERLRTWGQFVDAIKEQFFPRIAQQQIIWSLMNAKQQPNERTAQYLGRFNSLYMTLEEADDQIYMMHMIDGLSSRRLQEEVRFAVFDRPEEYAKNAIAKTQALILRKEMALNFSSAASASAANATNSGAQKQGNNVTWKKKPTAASAANAEVTSEGTEETAGAEGETAENQTRAQIWALSAEEKAERRRTGSCFNCGQQGHIAWKCPSRGAKGPAAAAKPRSS